MPITHLPAEGYRRMPWKNGAGTTSEVAVFPAGAAMDEFDWRIAIADLDRSGPFSAFPAVDRLLMVLPPVAVTLTIDGDRRRLQPFQVVRFAGESAVFATPAGHPGRDLNVMLQRSRADATMSAIGLASAGPLQPSAGSIVLCAIEGAVEVGIGDETVSLGIGDSVLIDGVLAGQRGELRPVGRPAMLARIDLRSPQQPS